MSAPTKRPRGRAPNDRFGVPKKWNDEVGHWTVDTSKNTPTAQDHVEPDDAVDASIVQSLTAERDKARQEVENLEHKLDEYIKELQLKLIARRPDMGVNAIGLHSSSRPSWWARVPHDTFVVLNDCFQKSLIGHKNRGSTTICAAPQINVEFIDQRFNPAEAAEYNQYLLNKPPFQGSVSKLVRYPWQRITTLGDTHNEIFAWHGTQQAAQHSLDEGGFDLRHVRSGKGLFGDGLYFSPHASKSDMYTEPIPSDDKTAPKSIYLVRLNMGHVWRVASDQKALRFPPAPLDTPCRNTCG